MENTNLNDALASNYMLVRISFRAWGGERINHKITDEVVNAKHATADAGKFRMKLLASADSELKAVKAQIVALRSFVYSRTLPWTLNDEGSKKGARLIATADAMQFIADTRDMKRGYDEAVLALQSVWDDRVEQAILNLGEMGQTVDRSVYPPATEIPSLFNVEIELHPMPTVTDFNRLTIPAQLAEALGQRLASQTQTQVNNAMTDLRDRLAEEVQRMATQLGKAGAGEKTKLYESMLTNTQSLCALARSMNLTGSERFGTLIDKIEQDLLRYPIDMLREDKATAAMVSETAKQVLTEISDVEWY
jgi:hypothetical protein